MKEVEVKILEINKEEIIKKLLELGAEKVFEGEIISHLYDFEDKRINQGRKLLRLRKKGEKNLITFKTSISKEQSKIEEEIETEIGDFEVVDDILKKIGLLIRRKAEKKRTSYKIANVLFEIDEPKEDVPAFLEIEAQSEEEIFEYVEKLGIEKERVKNWSGGEVLAHYGQLK